MLSLGVRHIGLRQHVGSGRVQPEIRRGVGVRGSQKVSGRVSKGVGEGLKGVGVVGSKSPR